MTPEERAAAVYGILDGIGTPRGHITPADSRSDISIIAAIREAAAASIEYVIRARGDQSPPSG